MKNRLKLLREELGVTQQKFADSVGISQNTYAKYEMGIRTPIKSIIDNICKTFNVNEQWLRTGEGEMFAPKGDSIDDLMTRYQLHPRCRRILETVLALPEPAQEAFCDFLDGMKGKMQKEEADLLERAKAEVRAEVEAETEAKLREKVEKELRAEMEQEKEDRERQAIHTLLDAQLDKEKTDKGSTLVFGRTKSKEA